MGYLETTEKWLEQYNKVVVELIDTEGQTVRDKQDDDHISELVNSMAKHGLLEPIVVRKKEDNRFQLVAGFHRLQAAIRLKWEAIPAHIIAQGETSVKALALVENLMRRDMNLDEECKAVTYMTDIDKLSPSQICDALGKSRAWVDRRLAIPHLPNNVRQAVLEGLISIAVAEIIGAMTNDGARGTMLNQAVYGKLTASQVSEIVALFQNNPSIQEAISLAGKMPGEMETQKEHGAQCAACGTVAAYSELLPVWVCRGGCRPRTTESPNKEGEAK